MEVIIIIKEEKARLGAIVILARVSTICKEQWPRLVLLGPY